MTSPIDSGVNPTPAVNPSADPKVAGDVKVASDEGGSSDSRISSMADLREKEPKLWNMILQGLAQNICSKMKENQDRLKRIMKENEDKG